MAELPETILQLHTTGRQTGQIQPFFSGISVRSERRLHQAVHTAPCLMFPVGEHHEAALQPRSSVHIAGIQTTGQRIPDQLHADPVEILHEQQI